MDLVVYFEEGYSLEGCIIGHCLGFEPMGEHTIKFVYLDPETYKPMEITLAHIKRVIDLNNTKDADA